MLEKIEVSLTLIVSIIAIILSSYSIFKSNNRNDISDLKELTKTLTEISTKLESIENSVLGKPTLSEIVHGHDLKFKEHDRRLTALEGCRKDGKL